MSGRPAPPPGQSQILCEDFTERFTVVFRRFRSQQGNNAEMQRHLFDVDEDAVTKAALGNPDKYLSGDPANLSYSFFIPLHGEANEEDGISDAAKRVLQQPQLF